jgi:hypothetical protein
MFRRFPVKPLIKPRTNLPRQEPVKEYDIEYEPYTHHQIDTSNTPEIQTPKKPRNNFKKNIWIFII